MKLYEIDQAILDCLDMETGEVLDGEKLDALEMERERKIENVALWVKDINAELDALRKEKATIADRIDSDENLLERLKNWIAYATDGQKFKTPKCSVSFRHGQKTNFTNEDAFMKWARADHDEYLRFKDPEPDKKAIKEAIKNGKKVVGCELVESVSTIIK